MLPKIEKLGINDDTANDLIKSCYEILMELIRAKMFLDGYNASGQGAHEAEVSYTSVLGFNEKDVQFLDQLRYSGNILKNKFTSSDYLFKVNLIYYK